MSGKQKLNDLEVVDLINSYIERYTELFSITEGTAHAHPDKNFWAYEKFAYLAKHEPDLAFALVLSTLAATQREEVLDNLAAGPLEDLIRVHGERFIERIEVQAHKDRRFRNLLGGVWKVGSADVWSRIEKLQHEEDPE